MTGKRKLVMALTAVLALTGGDQWTSRIQQYIGRSHCHRRERSSGSESIARWF